MNPLPKLLWFRAHRSFVDRQRVVLVEVGGVVKSTAGNVARRQRFAIFDRRDSAVFLANSGHLFTASEPPAGYEAPALPTPEKAETSKPDVLPSPVVPKTRPIVKRPRTKKTRSKKRG